MAGLIGVRETDDGFFEAVCLREGQEVILGVFSDGEVGFELLFPAVCVQHCRESDSVARQG